MPSGQTDAQSVADFFSFVISLNQLSIGILSEFNSQNENYFLSVIHSIEESEFVNSISPCTRFIASEFPDISSPERIFLQLWIYIRFKFSLYA